MRLKKFNQFKIFETFSISEIDSSMSDFLDDYDYYLENIENFNLVVLGDGAYVNHIYNLFRYDDSFEKFDEKFFSSLEKIEDLIPRSKISKSLKSNLIFTSSNHHMDINRIIDRPYYKELVKHIENLISQNKIKSYPIVKVNMEPACFWKDSKEHLSFISSLKSLFRQTGLRPIGRTWYEDYLDEEENLVKRLCFSELILIDCEDHEYKNLYKIFRFGEGIPDKDLFEIFI